MFGKLKAEATFPNSSLADDSYNTTIAVHCTFEFEQESGELVITTGQRTQPSTASKDSARGGVLKSPEFENVTGAAIPRMLLQPNGSTSTNCLRHICLFGD
jgi:hypothetical protein